MKRYDLNTDEAFPCNCNMLECQTGEFVRYKDVKPMTKEEAERLVDELIFVSKASERVQTKDKIEADNWLINKRSKLIAALTGKEE